MKEIDKKNLKKEEKATPLLEENYTGREFDDLVFPEEVSNDKAQQSNSDKTRLDSPKETSKPKKYRWILPKTLNGPENNIKGLPGITEKRKEKNQKSKIRMAKLRKDPEFRKEEQRKKKIRKTELHKDLILKKEKKSAQTQAQVSEPTPSTKGVIIAKNAAHPISHSVLEGLTRPINISSRLSSVSSSDNFSNSQGSKIKFEKISDSSKIKKIRKT